MSEVIFWERSSGYGVELNEYNGNFSLQAATHKDDKYYKEWVFLSRWNQDTRSAEPDEKKRPMGVYFGDRDSAIKALRFFLKELGASDPGDPAPDGSSEDIPF